MKNLCVLTIVLFFGFSNSMNAQFLEKLGKKAEEKVKREAEQRAENRVNKGIDKVYDRAEEEMDKAGEKDTSDKSQKEEKTKKDKKSKNIVENKEVSQKEDSGMQPQSDQSKKQEPDLQSYSKYDFVPGEKVIFFDDFTSESIGDFPLKWLTNGSGEVVTTNRWEGNFFKVTKTGYYIPEVHEKFTENFTVEFDMIPLNSSMETIYGIDFFVLSGDTHVPGYGSQPGQAGIRICPDYETVMWNNWSEAREWQGEKGDVAATFKSDQKYRISFWVQKQRIRMYINQQKVLDLPRGLQPNYIYNIFRIETFTDDATPYIGNFRIAAGQPDMRSKLITEGKLVSYGIYFDVNKDVVKPESYGTLKEIAQVLKDNPTVSIKITGHTDSDGDDVANLDLSKRRSESVKNELVKTFGIEESRLESDGAGETKPVAKNDTPANKALNRRVEFVKL